MNFLKQHAATVILVVLAASWIGISLGTNDCPACVVTDTVKGIFGRGDGEEEAKVSAANQNWSVVDTAGEVITHTDLLGKVGVLVYWATYCGACKEEIPNLVALREAFPADEVAIIGLSVDRPGRDLVPFQESLGINYQVARVNESIYEAFGRPNAIPTVMLTDQDGRVQFQHIGVMMEKALHERVESLLAPRSAGERYARY